MEILRRWGECAGSATLLLLALVAHAAAVSEYDIKAAFLASFSDFVRWPDGHKPSVFCVVGPDPFGPVLDHAVRRGGATGSAAVRRLGEAQGTKGCDIVFVASPENKRLSDLIADASAHGSLTVGESERFLRMGGVIALRAEGSHVRLFVNLEAAQRARFQISSRMLTVSKLYKDRP